MTVMEWIQAADLDELVDLFDTAVTRCTGKCPALGHCRNGSGCRAAIRAWLQSEAGEYVK